ncbi:hypothetical protein AB7M11_006014 [Bradyrhizobium ottawaense]
MLRTCGCAEPPVLARKAEAPLPLLAHDLDLGGVRRHGHELMPDHEAGRQHGRDTDSGPDAQPPFELFVLGIVISPSSLFVVKAEDAIGHEGDYGDENKARDPERDVDGVVDIGPVRGDRRPPPWAVEVKQHRADRDQKQYQCDSHPDPSLPSKATDTNPGRSSCLSRWLAFLGWHLCHRRPLASPIPPAAKSRECSRPSTLRASASKMIPA